MKRQSAVVVALTLASVTTQGCTSSEPKSEGQEPTDNQIEELIGGVPANSAKLDAIGTIGFLWTYTDCWSGEVITQYEPFCSASLISSQTVLTAKHCIEGLTDYADDTYRPVFAIGSDGRNPKRTIPIVEAQGAPVDQGGFVGYGRDVAVVQLDTEVTDIKPIKFAQLPEGAIGSRYAVIGYGAENNNNVFGKRLAGSVRLNATQGQTYQLYFGTYEAFKTWYLDTYGWYDDGGATGGGSDTGSVNDGDGGSDNGGSDMDAGSDNGGGTDGGADTGSTGSNTSTGGTGSDIDAFLRPYYDDTFLLADYEAYVGNGPGDVQPCFGDSGSPLVKANEQGELVAYGVASGVLESRTMICDFGAVYAAFGPETLSFLDTSVTWQDPCNDVTTGGRCSGDTATRCTALNEGRRRVTETDCSLLAQTCVVASNGDAMCVGEGEDPVIIDDGACPDLDGGAGGSGSNTGGGNGGTTGGAPDGGTNGKINQIRERVRSMVLAPLSRNAK